MSEEVINGLIAKIECDLANGDLTEEELKKLIETLRGKFIKVGI